MRRHSPYNYAFDNPIRFIDPDGMAPTEGGQCPEGGCKEGEGSSASEKYIKKKKEECKTGDCEYSDPTVLKTSNNGKGKVGAHLAKLDVRHKEGNIDVQFTGSVGEVSAEAKLSSGFTAESSDGKNKGKIQGIAGSLSAEGTVVQLGLKSQVGPVEIAGSAKVLGAKGEITAELSQNAIGFKSEAMAYIGKGEGSFSFSIFGAKIGVQAEVYEGAVGAGAEGVINFKERKASGALRGSLLFGGGLKFSLDVSKWFY